MNYEEGKYIQSVALYWLEGNLPYYNVLIYGLISCTNQKYL